MRTLTVDDYMRLDKIDRQAIDLWLGSYKTWCDLVTETDDGAILRLYVHKGGKIQVGPDGEPLRETGRIHSKPHIRRVPVSA